MVISRYQLARLQYEKKRLRQWTFLKKRNKEKTKLRYDPKKLWYATGVTWTMMKVEHQNIKLWKMSLVFQKLQQLRSINIFFEDFQILDISIASSESFWRFSTPTKLEFFIRIHPFGFRELCLRHRCRHWKTWNFDVFKLASFMSLKKKNSVKFNNFSLFLQLAKFK